MKRALNRAYQSEQELKIERDSLELKVNEKTKELKMIQAEEIARVHRFAEFGRLSSGLFHDLINPLTTVILNVGKIKEDHKNNCDLKNIGHDLDQALKASNRMGDFINAVRKQIKTSGNKEIFSLKTEIEEAIAVLDYKAKHEKVNISFTASENIILSGDPIKFNQIVTNLISNAIDACGQSDNKIRKIIINLTLKNGVVLLNIKDNGIGMDQEHLTKIFEPFFSTKIDKGSLGLGLSLIKNLIEKDFNGNVEVTSVLEQGSEFIVKIPIIKKGDEITNSAALSQTE
jgi:signal transduction histidine kinase